MKLTTRHVGAAAAMAAGLGLMAALLVHQGMGAVLETAVAVGWGMVLVLLVHGIQLLLSGLAWRVLFQAPAPAPTFIFARWIRESVNSLLPMMLIGGDIIGARLLALRGTPVPRATASVVVDLTMEVSSQCLFTVAGLALLVSQGHQGPAVQWTAYGLFASIAATTLFVLAQHGGMMRIVEWGFRQMAERWSALSLRSVDGLHAEVMGLYGRRRALANAIGLHLLSWLAGAAEVWVILHFAGVEVSPQEALVIESLGQAVRSAAFLIPGGFGVQEGGYMILASVYGLSPNVGLALSLVKRAREILLGVPGTLAWQIREGRRLWPRGRVAAAREPGKSS